MHETLAEFALEYCRKKGAKYVEVRFEKKSYNDFLLKNSIAEHSSFEESQGLGIRYLINNNLGFIAINKFDKENIKSTIEKSINLTKNTKDFGEKINFSKEPVHKINYQVKQKKKINNFDPEDKLNILKEIDKKIKQIPGRYLNLSDTITEKYFINSEGSKITSIIPKIHFFAYLTIGSKNKTIQKHIPYGSSSGYEVIRKWNLPDAIENDVNILTKILKKGVKSPKGTFDLICGPEITGIASHESVGHPYEADRIFGRESAQAGESFVKKDMLKTQIGSEIVNVVDNPILENSYGFYLYDDEGVKSRNTYLIKNGVINEFLHNRETAHKMNLKSNGFARASDYDKETLIRMSNTYVLPGDSSEEEIIQETKKGIFMKSYQEWNIDDKRYQQKYVGSEAYLIENGKITKPLLSPVLEVTTPKFWKSIDMVGNNLKLFAGNCGKGEPMQGIPVFMGGPTIRLKNIKLK
ncbi:TldD/PmbA family protein [archaeon]|nr:TldD/PmbA family protein [archaeon]